MTPTTPDELAMPGFEERLWDELDELHRERRALGASPAAAAAHRARRRGRRRLMLVAAALAGAAASVVISVGVRPDTDPNGGSDTDPGPGSGDPAPPLDPDVVIAGVAEATAPTDDAIVHARATEGESLGSVESWYDEVTAASRRRQLDPEGATLLDSGWPQPPAVDEQPDPALGGEPVSDFGQCDPGTGLMMDEEGNLLPCDPGTRPAQPFHAYRVVNHCNRQYVDTSAPLVREPGWGYLTMYLQTGDIVVDGREEIEGRELIRLRNRAGDMEYLVDPETYVPVQESSDFDGDGTPRITTYERLPRSAENLALLSPPVPDGFEAGTSIATCGGASVNDPG